MVRKEIDITKIILSPCDDGCGKRSIFMVLETDAGLRRRVIGVYCEEHAPAHLEPEPQHQRHILTVRKTSA